MARVRIFAGPNGSGKTSLSFELKDKYNLGYYINADDLVAKIEKDRVLDLNSYHLAPSSKKVHTFFTTHGLYSKLTRGVSFKLVGTRLEFGRKSNVYEIAILADFLRHSLLDSSKTFSFETVFSHPGKVDFIKKANKKGYRTYLYFVSTNSPEINIERVKQRVLEGGHDVPPKKIRSRYYRSLENLAPAIKLAYRTYVFDTSGKGSKLLAQVTPTKNLDIEGSHLPVWFDEFVISRLTK